ncbi:MAG: small, acid-soluble spore protein, alpha/beta type [Caldanaerobacter sp.]|uniref:small, acid-soluble spore protein, alpha/beta type n=1 Tax=Caldanaerobacter sp. TaxID=2930036 RepID=UPI003C7791C3
MEDRFLIEIFKWEAAEELGLLEKVKKVGWPNLSAQETGKIGVLVKRKIREKIKKEGTV